MNFLGPDPTRFPAIDETDEDGIIAVGGDLSPERLVQAYKRGIFPWYSEGLPILWHCPDPRFVLDPAELHVPKSLRKTMKRGVFEVRLDTSFEAVIDACAKTRRPGQRGTWITRDMRKAYVRLHSLGIAHSAEAWSEGQLVGGLYGVRVARFFAGESMFHTATDASKVALVALVERLRAEGVRLLDVQWLTPHLSSLGAIAIPRDDYLRQLAEAVQP